MTTDTTAIRAQMEALAGHTPGPWKYRPREQRTIKAATRYIGQIFSNRKSPKDARLIAAAPDMHATILALCDTMDKLRAENERLLGQIRAIAAAYDRAVPMRHADWHGTDCDCLRCNIDNARTALTST